jgi:putative addiction module component
MSVTAEKVAELLALPQADRAYLAHELIRSLKGAPVEERADDELDPEWAEVIDRRTREIEEGKVVCRPVEEVVQEIRDNLNASRQPS